MEPGSPKPAPPASAEKADAAGETEKRLPPHGIHQASGKVLFTPTPEWREVPDGAICPAGLEFKMDVATGKNMARLPPPPKEKSPARKSDARRDGERRRSRDRRDRSRDRRDQG